MAALAAALKPALRSAGLHPFRLEPPLPTGSPRIAYPAKVGKAGQVDP